MAGQGAIAATATALTDAQDAAALAYTDPRRALGLAAAARRSAPADSEVRSVAERATGRSYAALGRLTEAVRHLRSAARTADRAGLADRSAEALASLAYVLLLLGRGGEALRELDRAAGLAVDGRVAARVLMQRGLVLSEGRQLGSADRAFTGALDQLAQAGGDELLEADILNNRAIVRLVDDWPRGNEDLDRAELLFARCGHPGRIAMVAHNRGSGAALRGDLPAALAAFDDAAERYGASGIDPGLLEVERAEALLAAGLVGEAQASAERAVAGFDGRHNALDLVQARLLLAETALRAGDPSTARAEGERARRAALRQNRPGWAALAAYAVLLAREAAAGSDRLVGPRTEDSGPATDRGLGTAAARTAADLTAAGWTSQAVDARLVQARAALALGHSKAARGALADVATATRSGPAGVRARRWHAVALAHWAEGDRVRARTAVRSGLAVLDTFRASLGATELRAHVSSQAEALARLDLTLAMTSGRPSSVFAAAERVRASTVRLPPTRPPDDARLAAELADLRRLESDVRAGTIEPGVGRSRQAALERRIRDRARHALGAGSLADRSPTPREVAAALGERTLVEYVDVEGSLHVVSWSGGRWALHRLASTDEVTDHVDALRSGMLWLAHRTGGSAAALELVRRHARALDTLLLPLALGGGEGPLVIVPTGALSRLPWAALPSLTARPFTVTPSAAVWHRACTAPAGRARRVVLAHGPDLPDAAAEVADLATAYAGAGDGREGRWPTTVLAGSDATAPRVLGAIDGARLAHVAAHGRFRADNPMFSALLLADGPLTVHDIERLGRVPKRVVLASCDAGLGSVHSGDEVLGLAAALLGMGSVGLVAPVVPVADDASRALMNDLHDGLRGGLDLGTALARARAGAVDRVGGSPPEADGRAALGAAWGYLALGAG